MTQPPDPRNVLPYRGPPDDLAALRQHRERRRLIWGVVAGMFATWFVLVLIAMAHSPVISNGKPVYQDNTLTVLIIALIVMSALAIPAAWLWWRDSRGFAVGLACGLGVAVLISGICFGLLMH